MCSNKQITDKPSIFCIIDVEATGCSICQDVIFDVAIIATDFEKHREVFSTLIKADEYLIDRAISEIGHIINIDKENIMKAPTVEVAMGQMLEFIGELSQSFTTHMIAHGINFDYSFIKNTLDTNKIHNKHIFIDAFKERKIDTIALSKQIYPKMSGGYSLDNLAKFSQSCNKLLNKRKQEKHSALLDCEILESVVIKMLSDFPFLPQIHTK